MSANQRGETVKEFGMAAALAAAALATSGAADAAQVRVDFAGAQTGGTVLLSGGPAAISGWFIYSDAAPNETSPANGYNANSIIQGAYTVTQGGGFVCGGSTSGGVNLITVRNDAATAIGPRDFITGVVTSPLGCLSAVTTTSVRLLAAGPSTSWNDIAPTLDKWDRYRPRLPADRPAAIDLRGRVRL
ncbi:MAG: hypothetical protein K2Q06_03965 [Parvularculaceae bacterium]|nr:hypothetical protein [Parvularculaceae bacterium]